MAVAQGGQPEGVVLPPVFGVSDAQEAAVEDSDDGGHHLLARHAVPRQVAADALAQAWQRPPEVEHPAVLGLIPNLAPALVVAVLLAAPGVTSGGLQVPARIGTDPDVGPGRRDGKGQDPSPRRGVDRLAIRAEEDEAAARAAAPDPGPRVAYVAQPCGPGRLARVVEVGVYTT